MSDSFSEQLRQIAAANDHAAQREAGIYLKGERVYVRHTYGLTAPEWRLGIITDVFIGPASGQYVYVVAGTGYYPHEVRPDDGQRDSDGTLVAVEPQSLRA